MTIAHGMLPSLIGYNRHRAQVAIDPNFRKLVAAFDLTTRQFAALMLIRANRGLSQSELGCAIGIDCSTMVAVIDRLETCGLVIRERLPDDRRSNALKLSPAGENLVERMLPEIRAHFR